jgi:lipopolysaccharide/colanic/teichoic acid biosynthesis glycosyltransferase
VGWYEGGAVIGIIFTEVLALSEAVRERILEKVYETLRNTVGLERTTKIQISLHVFPEEPEDRLNGNFDLRLYPDSSRGGCNGDGVFSSGFVKRVIDVVGSSMLLVALSPVFGAIALAIKLNSKGPFFFEQERVGLRGKRFVFLKFRSMYTDCDDKNHLEYMEDFISGQKGAAETERREGQPPIFKLTDDPRITPVGRFLRKTSLDELPQFINVLKGEMSLVGPRPPIPYECGLYDVWHRWRLTDVKPGITGLWQVEGRSRTTFDNMVRLDLRYIKERSLWLDIKILLKTPWAVLTCKGAY